MNLTTLHLISLLITIPAILLADHMGFQYFTGRISTVGVRKARVLHWLVTCGICLLIVTGVMVTIPAWDIFLSKPLFYTKIAFVLTLLVNGILIGNLMKKATHTPYKDLPYEDKKLLLVSGAVSSLGWVISICIGFFGL